MVQLLPGNKGDNVFDRVESNVLDKLDKPWRAKQGLEVGNFYKDRSMASCCAFHNLCYFKATIKRTASERQSPDKLQ